MPEAYVHRLSQRAVRSDGYITPLESLTSYSPLPRSKLCALTETHASTVFACDLARTDTDDVLVPALCGLLRSAGYARMHRRQCRQRNMPLP